MQRGQRSGRILSDGGSAFVTESGPDEPTTRAVLRAVAAVEDANPTDLDPLYESVVVDAVERLVDHADERGCDPRVEFTFEGYTVTVRDDGRVRVTDDPTDTTSLDAE